jgi:hypothetical protein
LRQKQRQATAAADVNVASLLREWHLPHCCCIWLSRMMHLLLSSAADVITVAVVNVLSSHAP